MECLDKDLIQSLPMSNLLLESLTCSLNDGPIPGQITLTFNILLLKFAHCVCFACAYPVPSTFSILLFALGKWHLWASTDGSLVLGFCLFCQMVKAGRRSEGRNTATSGHQLF